MNEKLDKLLQMGVPFTIHCTPSNIRKGQGGVSWYVNIGDDFLNVRNYGDMEGSGPTLEEAITEALEGGT